jgi:hydroxyacylglutathione hydrolase
MPVAVDPGEAGPVGGVPREPQPQAHRGCWPPTHHADHVGGLPALAAHWKCPTFGPAREVRESL